MNNDGFASGPVWKELPLKALYHNPDNVNKMDSRVAKRLAASLDEDTGFGFVVNLVVMETKKKAKYMVLGGNQRLEVLSGMNNPPKKVMCCVLPYMKKAKRNLLTQSLNQVHGTDDREKAKELYESIVKDLGVSAVDEFMGHSNLVQTIISETEESVTQAVEESADGDEGVTDLIPATKDSKTNEGVAHKRVDAPELNRVYHGKCEEFQFPRQHFDALITDPPYMIGVFEKKWDSGEDARSFTRNWVEACLPSLKPGAFVGVFINTRQYDLIVQAMRDNSLIIRDPLVWVRYISKIPGKRLNEDGTVYTTVKNCVELIAVGQVPPEGTFRENYKKHGVGGYFFDECILPYIDEEDRKKAAKLGKSIFDLARAGKLGGRGYRALQGNTVGWKKLDGRRPSNVIVLPDEHEAMPEQFRPYFVIPTIRNRSKESEGHETQKRVALMEWLVKLLSPQGGTILDPFAGSGTTLEAALWSFRNGVGIDKSRKWAAKANKRLERVQHEIGLAASTSKVERDAEQVRTKRSRASKKRRRRSRFR